MTIGDLSAFTEVVVLTEVPCLSDTDQWVTYSLPLSLKGWRQETDITRRLKLMWFEMQYHINQFRNVTAPIPAAFTQAEGGICAVLLAWLGGSMSMHPGVCLSECCVN